MIVRKRVYPGTGRVKWQVDYGLVEGKRKVASFDSREEADRAVSVAGGARKRLGMLGLSASPSEMAAFLVAKERLRLAGEKVSIAEAVEFYLTHARRMREVVMVPAAVVRFRDAKDAEGCSARYYRQLGVSLGALGRWMPERGMHEVRREEIEAWLRGSGWAAKTRNNYLGDVRALFAWSMKVGFCSMNPAEGIAKARLAEEEIGTLSVGQCEVLLRGALQRPEMMGFIVLGLFGGLRPAEIQRLSWDAVDLREGTVIVAGSQAKTRRRRVVDLGENAVRWLRCAQNDETRMRNEEGKVCGRYWDARWRMFRRALGWAVGSEEKRVKETLRRGDKEWGRQGAWPHNALRHTYASMHYAMFQDEAKLQAQMGHESASMLHRHYRALVTKREAERFWGLRPG